MIKVKLVVFFVYIALGSCWDKYCKICLNHTLCKYPHSGPAANCKYYSISAQLSEKDITDILNRINERRNFVALGQSRRLPQAANMRKIVWSEELAMFAQRWADQCDSQSRPDREDQCRDLPDMAVGQNIATVLGSSPGLEVKSFIDLWYMQTLDYNGSVTYYNRSKDSKANYFTQLIWAESDTVGCGRAKFFDDHGKRLMERLVCNFAPRGNIHGKPVYAIGYPTTQCPEDRRKDEHFRGLCSQILEIQSKRKKPTTLFPSPSSVLRILIANNSAKQEIDPIKRHNTGNQRNQKIRHVLMNMTSNSYVGNKAFADQQQMYLYNNPAGNYRHSGYRRYQQEYSGHSRVYHDHEHKNNDIFPFKSSSEPDFRRYEFTTESTVAYLQNDLRKHNQFLSQCTRRAPLPFPPVAVPLPPPPSPPTVIQPMPSPIVPSLYPPLLSLLPPPPPPVGGCCPPNPCCYNRCARGPLPPLPPLLPPLLPCSYPPYPPSPVPLFPPPPPLPPPPPIDSWSYSPSCIPNAYCQTNCQCLYDNISPPIYPNFARSQDEITLDETRKSGGFHYYDLFPKLSIRSGDCATEKYLDYKHSKKWPFNKVMKSVSITHRIKDNKETNGPVNDALSYSKYEHNHNYPYTRIVDATKRKKRQTEDDNMRPFWQIDKFNVKLPSMLKAMRYTTLSNKRHRNYNKNTLQYTESITISLHNSHHEDHHEDHLTEKFLSFDELMHLRKFNDADDYRFLRNKKATTRSLQQTTKNNKKKPTTTSKKKPTTTSKRTTTTTKIVTKESAATLPVDYTTSPPFIPKKHCTRVLTCTWTIATITAQDGSIYNKGGNIGGSRTPPGYVEGCTRTSTCTRVFLNRNKVTEPSHDSRGSGGDSGSGGEGGDDEEGGFNSNGDEDYCERRSLVVKKKSGDEVDYVLRVREQKNYTDAPFSLSTYTLSTTTAHSLTPFIGIGHDLPYLMTVSELIIPSESTMTENHNCLCNGDNGRKKRDILSIQRNIYTPSKSNEYVVSCENENIKKYPFSYGDLYYLVLNKIIKISKKYKDNEHSKVCHCSSSAKNEAWNSLLFFIFIYRNCKSIFVVY